MIDIKADDETLRAITQEVLKQNPHLKLGETMTLPAGIAKDGKLIPDIEDAFHSPIPGAKTIVARSVKVYFPLSLEHFKISQVEGEYLHPYKLLDTCPDRAQMKIGNIIDAIVRVDATGAFETSQIPVTQQMIDDAQHVIFRYAIS